MVWPTLLCRYLGASYNCYLRKSAFPPYSPSFRSSTLLAYVFVISEMTEQIFAPNSAAFLNAVYAFN